MASANCLPSFLQELQHGDMLTRRAVVFLDFVHVGVCKCMHEVPCCLQAFPNEIQLSQSPQRGGAMSAVQFFSSLGDRQGVPRRKG